MPSIQLSAPVGLAPRPFEGAAVKNTAKDVSLLRDMLAANGIGPLGQSAKMDAGLIKAINHFQKKAGFKVTDSVVDPDGRTFKALLPKYQKALKALEKARKEPLYQMKFKRKTILCNKAEYDRLYAQALKNVQSRVSSLLSYNRILQMNQKEYQDTADFSNDAAMALMHALFVSVATTGAPNPALAKKAASAAAALNKLKNSKDLARIHKELPKAEKAIQTFAKDMNRFESQYISGGKGIVTGLEITRDLGFVAVGIIATPMIVTAGASLTVAMVASGAGVSLLQSAIDEGVKHQTGQTDDIGASAKKVLTDALVGGLLARIPTKAPKQFLSKISTQVAARVSTKTSLVQKSTILKYSDKVIHDGGLQLYKSSYEEAVKLTGDSIKKGKPPNAKDLDRIVTNIVDNSAANLINSRLDDLFKKFSYQHKDVITYTLVPQRLNKLVKKNKVGATLTAQAHAKIATKVSDSIIKGTLKQVRKHADSTLSGATAAQSPDQLGKKFTAACAADQSILSLIDAQIESELKTAQPQN